MVYYIMRIKGKHPTITYMYKIIATQEADKCVHTFQDRISFFRVY